MLPTIERLNTLKSKVWFILTKYPDARNDDYILYIEYIRWYHKDLLDNDSIKLTELFQVPKLDYMSRYRRLFQEYNELIPTDKKIALKRKKNQKNIIKTTRGI